MNYFIEISNMQKDLDTFILENRNVDVNTTFEKRKLALIVELSELANEVRSFKYWSTKGASDFSIILEEFSDCVHFCISLGNTINIDFSRIDLPVEESTDLNKLFLDIIQQVCNISKNDEKSYLLLLRNLFILANTLHITLNDVYNGYVEKNSINRTRQYNNY